MSFVFRDVFMRAVDDRSGECGTLPYMHRRVTNGPLAALPRSA